MKITPDHKRYRDYRIHRSQFRLHMRILFVHPSSNLNGAGRMVALLAKHLRRRNHQTLVLLPERGPLCQAHVDDLGEMIFVPMRAIRKKWGSLLRYILEFPSLVKQISTLIAAWEPDLVHVNCLYNIWGGLAARLRRVPSIYHIHEAPGSYPRWLYWSWQGLVSCLADRVVVVGSTLCSALPSCRKKLSVIENGVDVERLKEKSARDKWRALYAPANEKLILCHSHIMPGKNQILLVRAAPMIFSHDKEVRIVFLGHTHNIRANQLYLDKLKGLSISLGCADRIEFVSEPQDAVELYAAADLVVYPSPYESFGLVSLEALAAGRPVVSARTGMAETLQARGCPITTVPHDSAEELGRAVIEMLENPPATDEVKLPREYTAEYVAERFEELYTQVTAHTRRD